MANLRSRSRPQSTLIVLLLGNFGLDSNQANSRWRDARTTPKSLELASGAESQHIAAAKRRGE